MDRKNLATQWIKMKKTDKSTQDKTQKTMKPFEIDVLS